MNQNTNSIPAVVNLQMNKKKNNNNNSYRRRNAPYLQPKRVLPIERTEQATVLTLRGMSAFPDIYRTVLRYSDTLTVTTGSSLIWTFRGNSLFDPDYTYTGHQPRYFDQLMSIYSKYRVTSSYIKVSVLNAAATSPLSFTILPSTDLPASIDPNFYRELVRAKTTYIGVNGYTIKSLDNWTSTQKILGVKSGIQDYDMSGSASTSPAQLWYWNLFFASTVPSVTLNSNIIIELQYEAEFFDRIEVALS